MTEFKFNLPHPTELGFDKFSIEDLENIQKWISFKVEEAASSNLKIIKLFETNDKGLHSVIRDLAGVRNRYFSDFATRLEMKKYYAHDLKDRLNKDLMDLGCYEFKLDDSSTRDTRFLTLYIDIQ